MAAAAPLRIDLIMADNERAPSLKKGEINWHDYNYPPLLRVMHFVPAEVPADRRFLVFVLLGVHLAGIPVCLLNFVDNCIEGGLGILYSLLFALFFNPLLLFLFYRAFTGLCHEPSNLKLYLLAQPIVILLEVLISIVDFLGFNGFVRVSANFKEGNGGAGVLGLLVSLCFLAMAGLSSLVMVRILREKSTLTASLL